MGLFSFLGKKKEPILKDFPVPPMGPPKTPVPSVEMGAESIEIQNVKAKVDLLLTQLDSLKTQYQIMNERIKNIEQMVEEIRGYYQNYKLK